MNDQDTDSNQEHDDDDGALDIELVSVEEAEAEAAESRLAVGPEQREAEQVAEQVAEVLNQPEGEVESQEVEENSEPEQKKVEATPVEVEETRPPSLKTELEKVAEEDDTVLFDGSDNDGFIVIDDNEISSGDLGVKASRDKMADGFDIEGLTDIVLDAAGAANEAAHATNQSIHMLLGSVTTINNMADGLRKSNNYVLGFVITLGVVGLLSGATMLYVLQSAVKDATTINMAMSTKLVQFEKQMDRVNLLENQIIDVADVNHQLGQRLDQVMYHLKKVGTESQQSASQQAEENHLMLGSVNDQILTSFDDLKTTTKAQQAVLTQLRKRIDDLQLQMKKIQNQDLVGKMKALIALEQDRYFELEQAKLALETAQFEAKKKADAPPVEDIFITFGAKTK
jgi:hypothetical protein